MLVEGISNSIQSRLDGKCAENRWLILRTTVGSRMVPFIFMLLPVLLFFPVRTYADGWQPWQTAKEARIAWHYKWDKDWREYDYR